MKIMIRFSLIALFFFSTLLLHAQVRVGAERLERYLPMLKDKSIGIVGNQTSVLGSTHLVDTLLSLEVNVKKVFCPEHGFRGIAEAGELIGDQLDLKTGLPIVSIYGKSKKPASEQLDSIEMLIFDIQDVGARFYTYVSTLHYVMEACAENGITVLVLDRPNPNGYYIDGPILKEGYESFVGKHRIPVVHGMTIGEYARMINGERWLDNEIQCDLIIISCEGYDHNTRYQLPIRPSPNLPNMASVYLYPSLCFFEGTLVSIGRGTDHPFQCYGHPRLAFGSFAFTPAGEGKIVTKLNGEKCLGANLSGVADDFRKEGKLRLGYLIGTYLHLSKLLEKDAEEKEFFTDYFDKLAGSDELRKQIQSGTTEEKIRESWQADLASFKKIRKQYLLYSDFDR